MSVPVFRCTSIVRLGFLVAAWVAVFPLRAEEWLPATPEELQMRSEPKAPTAPAIYLYRQVDRDDNAPSVSYYARIKILTEEGRKYGDVEIPFNQTRESVRSIQARTIRPDGSVVHFDGTIYEKPIVQARGVRMLAKAFTLPDVQVGSIIEYRYTLWLTEGYVFDSQWILSDSLFTRYAKFTLSPYRGFTVIYSWPTGLPPGTEHPREKNGRVFLETRDVPAFETEEYMPPENDLKYRVDFIYYDDDSYPLKDPKAFWKKYGQKRYHAVEDFIDKPRAMREALSQIVAPEDSAEQKLRKIYSRVQQIRNVSFERSKSAQEVERDKQKDARNVEDVWSRGYGDGIQITWLFLALARTAGIQADPVLLGTRDLHFFEPRVMNPADLNSNLVAVKLDGKDLYLDPGVPFTPFGLLPWQETGLGSGLRLDKDGGSWITIPLPAPSDSRIERKASLRMSTSGALEGTVTVTYTGEQALVRRLEERNEDEADRKQFLEEEIKDDVPTGIDVTLSNTPDWSGSGAPLVAEYQLTVPGWVTRAGQRQLLAVGLFGNREKGMFKHASRVHPLHFSFPYQIEDDIVIALPAGWEVSGGPKATEDFLKHVDYDLAVEGREGSLHVTRKITFQLLLLAPKYYSGLREFFQTVRTHDEQQAILSPRTTTSTH